MSEKRTLRYLPPLTEDDYGRELQAFEANYCANIAQPPTLPNARQVARYRAMLLAAIKYGAQMGFDARD